MWPWLSFHNVPASISFQLQHKPRQSTGNMFWRSPIVSLHPFLCQSYHSSSSICHIQQPTNGFLLVIVWPYVTQAQYPCGAPTESALGNGSQGSVLVTILLQTLIVVRYVQLPSGHVSFHGRTTVSVIEVSAPQARVGTACQRTYDKTFARFQHKLKTFLFWKLVNHGALS